MNFKCSNYMVNYMNSQRHTLLAENYMLKITRITAN